MTYGIGYAIHKRPRPYFIVEDDTRWPVAFATLAEAQQQIRALKDRAGYDELDQFLAMLKERESRREIHDELVGAATVVGATGRAGLLDEGAVEGGAGAARQDDTSGGAAFDTPAGPAVHVAHIVDTVSFF
jgi:hypothetical protein